MKRITPKIFLSMLAIALLALLLPANVTSPASAHVAPPKTVLIEAQPNLVEDFAPAATPDTSPINLKTFADKLEAKLKGKCVGYAFSVSYKLTESEYRSGGEERRAQDPPAKAMSVSDKFNTASLSKTITAAAVMKLLNDNSKKVNLESSVSSYLPSHWKLGPNFSTITFRELLTHRSGIRCATEVDYANLKQCVQKGISLSDKKANCNGNIFSGASCYNNNNFALFRLIIPRLNGDIGAQSPPSDLAGLQSFETKDAKDSAQFYISYVQNNIFNRFRGGANIVCKPTDSSPALCYQFPKTDAKGTDFGDMTLTNASRGWNMAVAQLRAFFGVLHYSERMVPQAVSDQMKNELLGYDGKGSSPKGISWYWKGGYYPGKGADGKPFNAGEFNGRLIGFSNDIQVVIIVNSQFGPGLDIGQQVVDTMLEMV